MSSIINTSDGLAEASPDAVPKPYHNLSIVYIDHELEKPIKASAEAEAGENSRHPNLTVVYLDLHLNDSAPSGASHGASGSKALATHTAVVQGRRGLFCLPPEPRVMIWDNFHFQENDFWEQKHGLESNEVLPSPRPYCNSDKGRRRKSRWYLGVYEYTFQQGVERGDDDWAVDVPVLLHIGAESPSAALRHRKFVFGDRDGDEMEVGTLWNPDLDVLVFEASWSVQQHPWAPTGLQGLEHVKHVAIDENLARGFEYMSGYKKPWPYRHKSRVAVAI
ncbi:hypothetical protein F5883DRAFT_664930 [Diaporthe sp. PMI_573]|nr:hypothetical protein F5883DRAFT_664930 [Diaporthaceae sp. PMI_573]